MTVINTVNKKKVLKFNNDSEDKKKNIPENVDMRVISETESISIESSD
jgi:hypothetical protein